MAGHADRMARVLAANSGVRSRFAPHIVFPHYTDAELEAIAGAMLEAQTHHLNAGGQRAVADPAGHRRAQPRLAIARSIRNAPDRARLRQADRLFAAGGLQEAAAQSIITEADLRPGRVVRGGPDVDRTHKEAAQ